MHRSTGLNFGVDGRTVSAQFSSAADSLWWTSGPKAIGAGICRAFTTSSGATLGAMRFPNWDTRLQFLPAFGAEHLAEILHEMLHADPKRRLDLCL